MGYRAYDVSTKQVIRNCHGCKWFQVAALTSPHTENLPKERTERSVPYKFIGVDVAGPIKYLSKDQERNESLHHALLMQSQRRHVPGSFARPKCWALPAQFEVFRSKERMHRGKKKIVDNRKTFVAAAKWLTQARQRCEAERLAGQTRDKRSNWASAKHPGRDSGLRG